MLPAHSLLRSVTQCRQSVSLKPMALCNTHISQASDVAVSTNWGGPYKKSPAILGSLGSTYIHKHVYIYIYMHTCTYVYVYKHNICVYTYIIIRALIIGSSHFVFSGGQWRRSAWTRSLCPRLAGIAQGPSRIKPGCDQSASSSPPSRQLGCC